MVHKTYSLSICTSNCTYQNINIFFGSLSLDSFIFCGLLNVSGCSRNVDMLGNEASSPNSFVQEVKTPRALSEHHPNSETNQEV